MGAKDAPMFNENQIIGETETGGYTGDSFNLVCDRHGSTNNVMLMATAGMQSLEEKLGNGKSQTSWDNMAQDLAKEAHLAEWMEAYPLTGTDDETDIFFCINWV